MKEPCCSATRAGLDIGKKEINQMHVSRGFQCIGYNYVIRLDGTVEVGRSLTIDGAHCNSKGFSGVSYNKHSIGICYVGGLDAHGKAADTRTPEQKKALAKLIKELCGKYQIVEVLGIVTHRLTWTVMVSWNLKSGRRCVLASMCGANILLSLKSL
mgnify:CR=1 FL=1